jgi:hypothetical protein
MTEIWFDGARWRVKCDMAGLNDAMALLEDAGVEA